MSQSQNAASAVSEIARIEHVPLRDVWPHEAHDFTTWLEANIDVLAEATGVQLIAVEREQRAGAFSVDLIATDEGGDRVVIENQLRRATTITSGSC